MPRGGRREVSGSIGFGQEAVERRKLDESLYCGVHRKEQAKQGKRAHDWLVYVILAGYSASELPRIV